MNIYDVQGSHKKFTEIGVKASLCLHPPSTTQTPRSAASAGTPSGYTGVSTTVGTVVACSAGIALELGTCLPLVRSAFATPARLSC